MITEIDGQFRREAKDFDLRCTCESCAAFDPEGRTCAYGYPTEPHRTLPLVGQFVFCKAFELV
ncbi:MAG TPA: hypothetical protein VJT73_00975 [Polyangiaceae bacterium]|nr:hypothetical protein [Polyangiaceae bacterium]